LGLRSGARWWVARSGARSGARLWVARSVGDQARCWCCAVGRFGDVAVCRCRRADRCGGCVWLECLLQWGLLGGGGGGGWNGWWRKGWGLRSAAVGAARRRRWWRLEWLVAKGVGVALCCSGGCSEAAVVAAGMFAAVGAARRRRWWRLECLLQWGLLVGGGGGGRGGGCLWGALARSALWGALLVGALWGALLVVALWGALLVVGHLSRPPEEAVEEKGMKILEGSFDVACEKCGVVEGSRGV